MTDEGASYLTLADERGLQHILCAVHFREKAMKAGKGIGGERFREFRTAVNRAIYHPFESDESLDRFLCEQLDLYQDHSPTFAFLESLIRKKKKVCFHHTQHRFTAGHISTSRGEGSNSRFKGNGVLKKELSSSDLVRGVERILAIASRQETEATDVLC
jgi:hypothetical protein